MSHPRGGLSRRKGGGEIYAVIYRAHRIASRRVRDVENVEFPLRAALGTGDV